MVNKLKVFFVEKNNHVQSSLEACYCISGKNTRLIKFYGTLFVLNKKISILMLKSVECNIKLRKLYT